VNIEASGKLESIAATLVIGPVLALKWKSISKTRKTFRPTKFFICEFYLGESYWDSSDKAEIVLSSFGNKRPQLRIIVREPFSIRLTDVER
jgi:hypothetical protein